MIKYIRRAQAKEANVIDERTLKLMINSTDNNWYVIVIIESLPNAKLFLKNLIDANLNGIAYFQTLNFFTSKKDVTFFPIKIKNKSARNKLADFLSVCGLVDYIAIMNLNQRSARVNVASSTLAVFHEISINPDTGNISMIKKDIPYREFAVKCYEATSVFHFLSV